MPDLVDFSELLQRHLRAIEEADQTCRRASEARRAVFKAAAADGLAVPLLKLVLKERNLTPEIREELEEYRAACVAFERTPLGGAALAETDIRV